ncbi:hypothetical protein ASPCAL05032 [Aspergillus calidoustus]|uniref:Uncharacterized protein n=1 Tax=Aspergillus calidoustus TaxID=454130 RepID=A0A0U5FX62_ASPCI|nr:hypothetical protein ASPCAL05032 [Aspergillus calidoustus]
MLLLLCCLGLSSFPLAAAAGGWDDFSNNLATDLAPFLSLFGEQVTKQYLSESTTFLDYFIFAMAPMGILTAVVSAIRVCGSPSLRAFIGRAQEGAGIAEAELCSSTSRDVCELYNNGGIARVFGRPKILEVVYDPDNRDFSDGTAGIYTFQQYVAEKGKGNWLRTRPTKSEPSNPYAEAPPLIKPPPDPFAPNLSLNLGIRKQHPVIFRFVALVGLTLQCGVLTFAGVVTYYLKWEKDGRGPEQYACPLVLVGSVLVCGGMFLCAFLVGQSTQEEVWERRGKDRASMHWVQPGGQVIGDQTFDAFAYADSDDPQTVLKEYTVSWKRADLDHTGTVVWTAVALTVAGFVLQFTGLRAIHSAVAIAQLSATMVMSLARAALRMQRLKPEANRLRRFPDQVIGHELDWLALRIAWPDILADLGIPRLVLETRRGSWTFCGSLKPGSGLSAKILPGPTSTPNSPNTAVKVLAFRTRLAELTMSPLSQSKVLTSARHFNVEMVEVRRVARQLASAMDMAVSTIFTNSLTFQRDWGDTETILWPMVCEISHQPHHSSFRGKRHSVMLHFDKVAPGTSRSNVLWSLRNKAQLEGILGLWLWSMRLVAGENQMSRRPAESTCNDNRVRRIISTAANAAETEIKLWAPGQLLYVSFDEVHLLSVEYGHPGTQWLAPGGGRYGYHILGFAPHSHGESQVFQIFGWYASGITYSTPPGILPIWSIPTESPLAVLCAQEIFGSFIKEAFRLIDDIGSFKIGDEGLNFRLENQWVTELAKIFSDNQLGSDQEALLCVLPAVVSRSGLSSSKCALKAAKQFAITHRREKKWREAERVLRWIYAMMIEEGVQKFSCAGWDELDIDQIVLALAELYRNAVLEDESRSFGMDGIEWLSQQTSIPTAYSQKMIRRYKGVMEESSKRSRGRDEFGTSYLVGQHATLRSFTRIGIKPADVPTGRSELETAAKEGWPDVLCALLGHGADPNGKYLAAPYYPLCFAVQKGSALAVKELLDWGADPEKGDINGLTPLLFAANAGDASVVTALLTDTRTSVETKDTALALAAGRGHGAVVKVLLGHRADPNLPGKTGQTALHEAADGCHVAVVRILVEGGASVDAQNLDGRTALWLASKKGCEEAVKILLEHGANLKLAGDDGLTALHCAATNGNTSLVKMLLNNRADINAKTREGLTPLQLAENAGETSVAEILRTHSGSQYAPPKAKQE